MRRDIAVDCLLCHRLIPPSHLHSHAPSLYHFISHTSPPSLSLTLPCPIIHDVIETLGFVVLESMASGVPVIGCAAGGIPDLIRHGDTGFIVPPGDVEAYTACAQQLMKDATFRLEMGKRARAEAELWGWEAATSVLRNVQYEKAMINFHSRAFGGFGNKKRTGGRSGGLVSSSTLMSSVWGSIRMQIGRVLRKLRLPGFRRRNIEEKDEAALMYYI